MYHRIIELLGLGATFTDQLVQVPQRVSCFTPIRCYRTS